MSSLHKIGSHNVSCSDFGISTKQLIKYNILKSPMTQRTLRAQDTLGSASNKKSIRWMFCLRARVNDASDYQWGVRLSTEKNWAGATNYRISSTNVRYQIITNVRLSMDLIFYCVTLTWNMFKFPRQIFWMRGWEAKLNYKIYIKIYPPIIQIK